MRSSAGQVFRKSVSEFPLRRMILILSVIFTASGISARASVTVRYSATVPTENMLTGFIPASGSGFQWRDNASSKREIGQSFRSPDDAVMTSFSLQAAGNIQPGAGEAAFTVTLYESTSDTSPGKVVSKQSGKFLDVSNNPVDGGWLTFELDELDLKAGYYYSFVLSWDNPGVPRQEMGFNHSNEGYADGRLWQINSDSAPTSSRVDDFAFIVQCKALYKILGWR